MLPKNGALVLVESKNKVKPPLKLSVGSPDASTHQLVNLEIPIGSVQYYLLIAHQPPPTSPVSPALCITDQYYSSTPGSMSHPYIMSACSRLCVEFELQQCDTQPWVENMTLHCIIAYFFL